MQRYTLRISIFAIDYAQGLQLAGLIKLLESAKAHADHRQLALALKLR
jgi:hypothetical protein